MKTNQRSNILLVELLIVIMFFMLAATVLARIFGEARLQSLRAERIADMVGESQNVADRLYAASSAEELLEELGFSRTDDLWTRETGQGQIEVRLQEEQGATGILRRQEVTALDVSGEILLSLRADRFQEVSP